MIKLLRKYSNATAAVITSVAITTAYFVGLYVGNSIWSYVVAMPALAVLLITAIARVNDISNAKTSKRWQVRRAGLSIVAGSSATLLVATMVGAHMGWGTAALIWGFAMTWLTTPEMPPWWRWISGRDQTISDD